MNDYEDLRMINFKAGVCIFKSSNQLIFKFKKYVIKDPS
jgi:hypothetical protein